MSSIRIICPPSAAITDIADATCFESFGQVQKIAFQRQYSAVGVRNSFAATGVGDIKLLASWTVDLAAVDGTKIQVSPIVEAPTFEAGAARTTGGGNASVGGITKKIGLEVTTAEFSLNSVNQGIITQLKALQGELALGVYLFNEHGQIGCIVDNRTTPTAYYPIPIAPRTFFVSDKRFGGLEEEDRNQMMFDLFGNWSDNFVIVNPTDFNPLTALTN